MGGTLKMDGLILDDLRASLFWETPTWSNWIMVAVILIEQLDYPKPSQLLMIKNKVWPRMALIWWITDEYFSGNIGSDIIDHLVSWQTAVNHLGMLPFQPCWQTLSCCHSLCQAEYVWTTVACPDRNSVQASQDLGSQNGCKTHRSSEVAGSNRKHWFFILSLSGSPRTTLVQEPTSLLACFIHEWANLWLTGPTRRCLECGWW